MDASRTTCKVHSFFDTQFPKVRFFFVIIFYIYISHVLAFEEASTIWVLPHPEIDKQGSR